jgi:SAM-dependent methyltransferase
LVDGVVEAIGTLSGTNRIAATFYSGPGWSKFQPFEQLFLWFQGPGPARARRRVLRFLPRKDSARVLEVGIGDGANLWLLPEGWTVLGVDIARRQLDTCRAHVPTMRGRLVLAEAEALPFDDATFDAVFSVGGFNYFSDHAAALREMRRVARPGAPVVVADERPDLYRFSIGSLLGLEAIERWSLRATGLDPAFVEMVLSHRINIPALARSIWPGHRLVPIWNRLGYCLVDPDPWPVRPPDPSMVEE